MYDEERPYKRIEQSEDSQAYRQGNWDMAEGLQAVDGVRVSAYAREEAARYIRGEISARELRDEVERYYEAGEPVASSAASGRADAQREADTVAVRINELLADSNKTSFKLFPGVLKAIHGVLFAGILGDRRYEGEYRDFNLEKDEPVLGGRSVEYAPAHLIGATLDYDFAQEKEYSYSRPLSQVDLTHFVSFIADVWQCHPFAEGNTRTCAVFSQLYLRSLGVDVDNGYFKEWSAWYRDALVRANYASIELGIEPDSSFLMAFYDNVVFGKKNDLGAADLNIHGIRDGSDLPYRES